ncbi:MAG: GIY-YIG nuclease family protein [Verrucomicrobiota bacterium]
MPPPSLRYGAASRNPGLQDSIPLGLAKPITTLQTSLFIPLESSRNQIYTGITCDLKLRLAEHTSARVPHTSKFTPWEIRTATAFKSKERAVAFERYLKSGSGRAFLHRHF